MSGVPSLSRSVSIRARPYAKRIADQAVPKSLKSQFFDAKTIARAIVFDDPASISIATRDQRGDKDVSDGSIPLTGSSTARVSYAYS